ncbi:MAG: DUF2383 domain-containing protein, partial [Loktanella sp.]|nr:DUF2383 domain-containing protein [Loktanella sp.]
NLRQNPDDERLDLIVDVHTSVLDSISGYDKLVEKAEPAFKATAQDFLTMHSRHETTLAAYLAQSGRVPDENGSFFGTLNRAVIEARSWFQDVDSDLMKAVADGEKRVQETYQQARDAGQTVEANAMLTQQMEEIQALLRKNGV